ncbi:MAG TPA: 8-amino-7-oxononanoate synthase [Arenibacter sp.]|nr:8-amino-7-oxononanoate synthase [Arenibacter sp.]
MKLTERADNNALRKLPVPNDLVDFSSNDYLGLSKEDTIFRAASKILDRKGLCRNGSTGSRLLTGNSVLYGELESFLAEFFDAEAVLVFNSGYDANIGFFSAVPQRGDIVLYDELCHASIRDGIGMGLAQSYKFRHNDLGDLSRRIERMRQNHGNIDIYVVTESVFSMDGDIPDLRGFVEICNSNNCYPVVDEAHAVGVFGDRGSGLLGGSGLQKKVFARIVTFGKAAGCHGAAILGSGSLKSYLVNFARSFIYTTAMPPHALATVIAAFNFMSTSTQGPERLRDNIDYFRARLRSLHLDPYFITSHSAIHCCVVEGNEKVKACSKILFEKGFDVKPILSPTVPLGKERLRFCLHSFNTEKEMTQVLTLLSNLL